MPTHVLILEDREDAMQWLSAALREAFPGCTLDQATSIAAARACIACRLPRLAVIDLSLPDGSGIAIIELLRNADPDIRCVVATVFADDQHLFSALRAGASGYILKEETGDALVLQLRTFANGDAVLSGPIAARLVSYFHPERDDDVQALSGREREVLGLLAKGLSIPKVAEMLGISANTAATYTKQLYRKLNVTSRAEATLEATRRGLIKL